VRRRAIALLLPLCVLASCRTPDFGVALPAADPRPAALLETLVERGAARAALRARARLDLDAPDVTLDRPQRLAVARPARMRVEVLGLFDQVAAVVVTDGDRYQVYDARRNAFEEGPVEPDLLWRVARVDLEPVEAVDLLLGAPRPGTGLRAGPARLFEDGAIAFERVDEDGAVRERYRFDGAGRLAEAVRADADGRLVWRARFDDYRGVAAAAGPDEEPFAHEVSLEFPRVDAKVRLVFKHVVLVDDLPDALFSLRRPAGAGPSAAVRAAVSGARAR
jgi:hypothetical protein